MGAPKGHAPYPGCETGGRPTKYTKEFIEAEADALEEWMNKSDSIYFKKFAFERGYSHQRMSEFAEANKKFSDAFTLLKEWQEIKFAEGGLLKVFDPGFTRFVMANACGWSEKQETKVSGDATNPLSFIISDITGSSRDFVEANEAQE